MGAKVPHFIPGRVKSLESQDSTDFHYKVDFYPHPALFSLFTLILSSSSSMLFHFCVLVTFFFFEAGRVYFSMPENIVVNSSHVSIFATPSRIGGTYWYVYVFPISKIKKEIKQQRRALISHTSRYINSGKRREN